MTAPDDAGGKRRTRTARTRAGDSVTIEEVARRAGVSVATVSRALRGLPNVAVGTRARVESVARELDYHPDTYASRLATGRNDTVALAVPHIDGWYFSEVAAGVERVLAAAGMDVLLYSVGDQAGRHRLLSGPAALRRRMDGLVLIDVLLTDEETEVLAQEGANVVTVGQHTDAFPSVTVDERAAAGEAVRHLVDLGHTRIAFVGSTEPTPLRFDVPTERRAGYRDVLEESGLRHDPALEVGGDFRAASGHAAMARLLSLPDPPTGVFAISDEMAIGAMRAARDHARHVPQDISIVGFDDHDFAEVFGLTTVRQDPQWQGETAGRLLLGQPADPEDASRHPAAEFGLVVRSSTGPARRGGR